MKRYIIEVPEEITADAIGVALEGVVDYTTIEETTMKSQAEIEHEWTFKETLKQHKVYGNLDRYNCKCTYTRIDVYYCKKTCEIKEVTKEIEIPLMWGGTVDSEKPIWY